ncbi:iron-containing alcohol dehydrogenase [Streptomyces sp. NPDC002896]|uniref:iron-containing alcohol dehydrogenase n=1 Tax=Streptomyces sp. NPDC002896 TaxID=3154438 RepID=UPI00331749B4
MARVHEIVQHVPIENAARTVALARAQEADAVITIGGGSSIGLAKIVARDAGLPIDAVPTTFAGSEATSVWGITEAGRKTTGVDDKVLPKVVVYDASLMASLPGQLAVSSGLNAVAHAVDGFWAPGGTRSTRRWARRGCEPSSPVCVPCTRPSSWPERSLSSPAPTPARSARQGRTTRPSCPPSSPRGRPTKSPHGPRTPLTRTSPWST